MNFAALLLLLVKISIILAVFASGLRAALSDVTYFLHQPGQLVRAFLSMNIVMPIFAVLICLTFDLHPAVEIALVVLSVSPVPPILPNKALKAGGRESYTIGLLVTTGLLSVVTIPLAMEILQRVGTVQLSMSGGAVLKLVLSTIVVPLILGMLFRAAWPAAADRIGRPVGVISMIILVLFVSPIAFWSVRSFITLVGDGTLIALASFAIVGLVAGHLLGGPDNDNRPVLALATASRHPAIALAIAHTNFPNQKLAAPCVLVYALLSAILSVPYLNWTKRTQGVATAKEKHVEA